MSAAAKCYSPVTYRGEAGSLTCTETLLTYTPENQTTKESIRCWPCSTIQRHMIKSVNDSKHLIRLIFDQGSPVILEVTRRDTVEQIRKEITQARKKLLQQQQQQQAVNDAPPTSSAAATPSAPPASAAPSPSSPRRANKYSATSLKLKQQSPVKNNSKSARTAGMQKEQQQSPVTDPAYDPSTKGTPLNFIDSTTKKKKPAQTTTKTTNNNNSTNRKQSAPPTAYAIPYTATPSPCDAPPRSTSNNYNNNSPPAAPPGAGTDANLPQNVRDIAKPRGAVIAWSHLDPALEEEISKYICWRIFAKADAENTARSQYWILASNELKIVSLDHDETCIPNMSRSGDIVKTVPLENITDCGLDARGTGWVNQLAGDVPTIYIDTASSGGSEEEHEATGIGLKDYDWFIQQILHQLYVVKHGGGGAPAAQSMNRPPAAGAGGGGGGFNKSTAERIQELTQLRDQGIVTEAEFQQQRQAIISSV